MTGNTVRQKYLDFFERAAAHVVVPSSNLVPENDPTTLFTGSGMQPMVPYLLGQPHPEGTRIVDSQKCFRSQDIEEVGDNRHTTFFEMLGNWSLGDYFKKEQLRWFFTYLTQEVGLDASKIYVTVFRGSPELNIPRDDESVKIWQELFAEAGISSGVGENPEQDGMQPDERIFFFDEKKNWWSRAGVPANMPAGEPGGPDSEVFYDFGSELGLHEASEWKDEPCHVNCDCGRFLEIGNSVFMQYQKLDDGSFTELPQQNVDFGGGLERILAAQNGDSDVFKTDIFTGLIDKIAELSNTSYEDSEETKRSYRVIADHMRAAIMLASDGVYPGSKEQGYFARRLVRRSIRYGKMIGIDKPFLAELVPIVAEVYKEQYPDIGEKAEQIAQVMQDEEKKFQRSLDQGLKHIEKLDDLDGETAFYLYQTYGFPFELTQEIAAEKGWSVDEAAFDAARKKHAEESRTASVGMFKGGLGDQSEVTVKYHTATHLLQAALRKVLGTHVEQKGSNLTPKRLRFDFTHPQALTDEEKQAVLTQINDWVAADLPVHRQEMSKDEALKSGAIAFFIEKYPDQVSVYTVGTDPDSNWISKELCGGPHVEHTGEIGELKIDKEQAASAGVRRLYLSVKE